MRRAFHPGSNVTGVIFRGQHAGERVKLLSEFAQGKTHAGALVARILKGEKRGDIPFDESTKVELSMVEKPPRHLVLPPRSRS